MLNKIKKIISKKNKSKIICLTAYSKNFAEVIDKYSDIVKETLVFQIKNQEYTTNFEDILDM